MNLKQLNETNIDDFIRQEKRIGRRDIFWNENGWSILKQFFKAHVPCIHGWFCLCTVGIEKWTKQNFKDGITFMGVKHYKI